MIHWLVVIYIVGGIIFFNWLWSDPWTKATVNPRIRRRMIPALVVLSVFWLPALGIAWLANLKERLTKSE